METVYGNPTEEIPDDMPTPKGRCVYVRQRTAMQTYYMTLLRGDRRLGSYTS